MNQYRIYRQDNYIFVVNNTTKETQYGFTKEVFIDKSNINLPVYRVFNVKDFDDKISINITQILKEDGTSYTQTEFETFYLQNTGNFNQGGSGQGVQTVTGSSVDNTDPENPVINAVEEAPQDGETYGRQDGNWVVVSGAGGNQTLDEVLVQGNTANDQYVVFKNSSSSNPVDLSQDTDGYLLVRGNARAYGEIEASTLKANTQVNTPSMNVGNYPSGNYVNFGSTYLSATNDFNLSVSNDLRVLSNTASFRVPVSGGNATYNISKTKPDGSYILATLDDITNYIKSNESLTLARRKDDVLYGILDQYTGEEITLYKITGTPIVDNVIYFQLGSEYFKRNYSEFINVKWFGAKGDNITDDTVSIQNTINAVDLDGGGTVFIPNGTYIIGGVLNPLTNSQLYIPFSSFNQPKRNHITIRGESKPNLIPIGGGLSQGLNVPAADKTVILKTTITTYSPKSTVIGSASGGINETFLSVEDLAIQILNNPTGSGPVIGGISYKNGGSLNCEYVVVYIDTNGFSSVLPVNDVTGIETPDNYAETFNSLKNTLTLGLRNGYVLGEHVAMSGTVMAMTCFNAFQFKEGFYASTGLRAASHWCKNDILVTGRCTLNNINLSSEWQQIGKWYDSEYTIRDDNNLAYGNVNYCIIRANFGNDNSKLSVFGANNLFTTSIDGYRINKTNPILQLNALTANGSSIVKLSKVGVDKWAFGTDILSNGNGDFWIYDYNNSMVRVFITPTGIIRLGADGQTSNTTSAMTIFPDKSVVHNGKVIVPDAVNTDEAVNLGQLNGVITNTVSAATTLSVVSTGKVNYHTFTGTTATYTAPALTGNTTKRVVIINQGTGDITLNSNAGANEIWESGVLMASLLIPKDTTVSLYNNSINWSVLGA